MVRCGGEDCPASRPATVELTLYPVIECTETKAGDPASERCEQVPGQFEQVVHIGRTPARIDVTERRDGVLLGERSFSPRYTTQEDESGSCDGDAQEVYEQLVRAPGA
ncbi:hypothetical protein [Sorangium sp. So ce1335]|uniref:hypothetical protein n=1 Tax=Sorangium sp. So ce1335 TaxID=3133335 RepID=UPI003F61EEBC